LAVETKAERSGLGMEQFASDQGRDAEKMKSEEPMKSTENTFSVPSLGLPFSSSSSGSTLQTATTVIEAGAGLALLCFPSVTVALLLGAPPEAPDALTVARVAGAALLALGVAFWLARGDSQSRAARGLVAAMVLYNLGVVVILVGAGIRPQPVGIALWLAVVLHAAMTVWCIVSLLSEKPRAENHSSSGGLSRRS